MGEDAHMISLPPSLSLSLITLIFIVSLSFVLLMVI